MCSPFRGAVSIFFQSFRPPSSFSVNIIHFKIVIPLIGLDASTGVLVHGVMHPICGRKLLGKAMTDSFERGSGDGEQQAFSVGELLQLPLELLLLLRASAEQFAESVELGVADLE